MDRKTLNIMEKFNKNDISLWQSFQNREQHPERCPYGIMRFDEETGKIIMYRDINVEQQWLNKKL